MFEDSPVLPERSRTVSGCGLCVCQCLYEAQEHGLSSHLFKAQYLYLFFSTQKFNGLPRDDAGLIYLKVNSEWTEHMRLTQSHFTNCRACVLLTLVTILVCLQNDSFIFLKLSELVRSPMVRCLECVMAAGQSKPGWTSSCVGFHCLFYCDRREFA